MEVARWLLRNPDTFSFLILKDIHRAGPQSVVLSESINLYETSTGWNFINQNKGRTLYWVGDSGHWQDEQHWAITSGGVPGHCPPTLLDTAIYDQNSFDQPFHATKRKGPINSRIR
jgi:hypothetical protein